jgi:hypothetical protein
MKGCIVGACFRWKAKRSMYICLSDVLAHPRLSVLPAVLLAAKAGDAKRARNRPQPHCSFARKGCRQVLSDHVRRAYFPIFGKSAWAHSLDSRWIACSLFFLAFLVLIRIKSLCPFQIFLDSFRFPPSSMLKLFSITNPPCTTSSIRSIYGVRTPTFKQAAHCIVRVLLRNNSTL